MKSYLKRWSVEILFLSQILQQCYSLDLSESNSVNKAVLTLKTTCCVTNCSLHMKKKGLTSNSFAVHSEDRI